MRIKLDVQISEQTGLPYAVVPSSCMWDLVEYLSFQRVQVTYDYRATHFTVCFPRTDLAGAQAILDEWSRNQSYLEVADNSDDNTESTEISTSNTSDTSTGAFAIA